MGVQLDAGKGGKKGATPNINVTPLVDVVLVLLIIFMVVIPNVQDGKSIELFKAMKEQAVKDKEDNKEQTLIVTVDLDKKYFIEKKEVSKSKLLAEMRDRKENLPKPRILLRADTRLKYGIVRDLFAEAQKIGFPHIQLAVGTQKEGWEE